MEFSRDDVRRAYDAMARKKGHRSLGVLESHLDAEETVLRMAYGNRSNPLGLDAPGVLVLTDRRLVFISKGLISLAHESAPLDLITSVAVRKGMLTSAIKTQGAQSMEQIEGVEHGDAASLASALTELFELPCAGTDRRQL